MRLSTRIRGTVMLGAMASGMPDMRRPKIVKAQPKVGPPTFDFHVVLWRREQMRPFLVARRAMKLGFLSAAEEKRARKAAKRKGGQDDKS